MATGEGKTLVATLPVFLNALTGNGVHVVTAVSYTHLDVYKRQTYSRFCCRFDGMCSFRCSKVSFLFCTAVSYTHLDVYKRQEL